MQTQVAIPTIRQFENALPSSEESERCILGSVLIDDRILALAAESLTPMDFYSPLHRRIYSAMLALFERKEGIDPISVGEEMKKDGPIDSIGGITTITNLNYGLPMISVRDADTVTRYIQTIRERKQVRDLISTCTQIINEATEGGSGMDVISRAQTKINAVCTYEKQEGFTDVATLSIERVNRTIALRNRTIVEDGLKTGLRRLDFVTSGFQKSDLIILAGRPAMGKSALAGQIAMNAAEHNPGAVIPIFSLEMSKEQYVDRLLASKANVQLTKIRTGYCSDAELERLRQASVDLHSLIMVIQDSSVINTLEIRSRLLRLKQEKGRLDGIVVDFLQRMTTAKKTDNRQNEVSNIARDLKSLAKDFDIPVIALSSLSRASEARNPPRPRMSDLRESGDIESEADFVAFVYRPHYYNNSEPETLAELIIDKHRNGPTETVKLNFLGEYTRFTDYEF